MKLRGFLTFVAAVALLSGCTAAPPAPEETPATLPTLIPTTVDPETTPGFLLDPEDQDHPLPAAVADANGVDVEFARYQGELGGDAVYLSVVKPGDVIMLTFEVAEPGTGGSGTTAGNSPMGISVGEPGGDRWMLQYLPQGTEELPDGWTALSTWVASREY